ncbi:hypothetical protein G9F72_026755 [Clostridium estertheticum]|uniref:hypothetical protein n=1 Tax=Clostridium estertheticum TaxID=238834 RepID=UPI0013E98DDA|nr:hypothetical protein [Clostridium estertheticum]MBZ9689872.1 hypothetical protein [Clostridium estertheticum]
MLIIFKLSPYFAVMFFIISGFYYFRFKNIKSQIRYVDKSSRKDLAKDYKRAVTLHCIYGYISFFQALVHVVTKFHSIILSLSWFLVLLYIIVLISGIYGKHSKKLLFFNKHWRKIHGFISILALLVTVVHILAAEI